MSTNAAGGLQQAGIGFANGLVYFDIGSQDMSVAIYIACETELDGEDTFVCGKALGHVDPDVLERVEKKIGCKPLYEFMSYDPEDVAEFLDDPDESELAPEEWFSAREGLRTVQELQDHIRNNPSSVPNHQDVIEDLSECERVLKLLESRGIGFHFAIDY